MPKLLSLNLCVASSGRLRASQTLTFALTRVLLHLVGMAQRLPLAAHTFLPESCVLSLAQTRKSNLKPKVTMISDLKS